jgi:hypothetical protein
MPAAPTRMILAEAALELPAGEAAVVPVVVEVVWKVLVPGVVAVPVVTPEVA